MHFLYIAQHLDFLILCAWIAIVTPRLMWEDMRSYTLPNRLVLPGWLIFCVLFLSRWIVNARADWYILLSACVVFCAFAMFAFGGVLGMGDAKLGFVLAGSFAFVSFDFIIFWLFCTFLLGGLFAVCVSIKKRTFAGQIAFGPFMLAAWWLAYFVFVNKTLVGSAIAFS